MSETHISDWELKNGITTAATGDLERNEGGTVALGNHIPLVPRDDLHAVPDAVSGFADEELRL